jgi:hypothetical protein
MSEEAVKDIFLAKIIENEYVISQPKPVQWLKALRISKESSKLLP